MFHGKRWAIRLGLMIAALFCASSLHASPHTAQANHKSSHAGKPSPKPLKKTPPKKQANKKVKSTTHQASSKPKTSVSRRTKVATTSTQCKTLHGKKRTCTLRAGGKALNEPHKQRVKAAQKTAMNKLMGQLGKPYRFGGTSPVTGFDCSGLVYYAYKDLVNFKIPRTANEMYHLRDAAAVSRSELESGDLVFFRTQGRGVADHVGVYVGNGKFIQSPSTGKDIQITSLGEDYWKRHYVGAKRVMTPRTIR